MKLHSREEREEVKRQLPKPINDFLTSPTLNTIYVGIQTKHKLNLRQLGLFADIGNVTLMGLETESALETNLHQAMPELSNEGARELVADINDRVFKEARRRVSESILEPSAWSEVKTTPELSEEEKAENKRRELIETMRDDDPELLALYERDRKEAEEREAANKKELEEALEQAKNDPPLGQEDDAEDETPDTQVAGAETAPVSNIALQKLTAPTAVQAQEVQITKQENGIQQITAQRPVQNTPQAARPNDVGSKIYPGGNDPYREPVE